MKSFARASDNHVLFVIKQQLEADGRESPTILSQRDGRDPSLDVFLREISNNVSWLWPFSCLSLSDLSALVLDLKSPCWLEAATFKVVVRMIKEDILKVKTCELKVNIYCQGCVRKLKKILHKIDGVYQTTIDAHQGKVTITGVMETEAVVKKLKKSGKLAHLWDLDTERTSDVEKLQLGGEGNSQPQDGASSSSSGGAKDSEMLTAQPMPLGGNMPFPVTTGPINDDASDSDSDSNVDIEDDNLERLMRTKPVAVLPVIGGDEKGGGGESEIPVTFEAEDTNNTGDRDSSTKQNQSSGAGCGPATVVSAPMLLPQPASAGTMRPPTQNGVLAMGGVPMRHPYMSCNGVQPGGGFGGAMYGMPAGGMTGGAGCYPGGAGGGRLPPSEPEMMTQTAAGGNPMAAPPHQHMAMQPLHQQQPTMMMNGHGPHGHRSHYGHGGLGYPTMGYGYGFGHPPMLYPPPPIYYPTMLQPHPHDNIFSDENPNSCSLM